jgi:hypothetical protein
MRVLAELFGIIAVSILVYGAYRVIVSEKDRDLRRREDEIKRKDQEIERLLKERELYK